MTAVLIFPVHSVCCNLIARPPFQDCDSTVLNPGIKSPRKQGLCLLRHSGSRNIPIFRHSSQYRIAHTAAYRIGFISVFLQRAYDILHIFRHFDMDIHCSYPLSLLVIVKYSIGRKISARERTGYFKLPSLLNINKIFPSMPYALQVYRTRYICLRSFPHPRSNTSLQLLLLHILLHLHIPDPRTSMPLQIHGLP